MTEDQKNGEITMTQEEKAKRYDEALEKARQLYAYPTTKPFISDLQDLFPELAESEDERIRKELIKIVNDHYSLFKEIDRAKTIAWLEKQGNKDMGISNTTKQKLKDNLDNALEKETPESWNEFLEKQGEQKPVEWHREDEQNLNACLGYIPDEYLRRWLMDVVHVKYDKPADKIEPKFHEGEWVVSPNGVYWHIDRIENNRYEVSSTNGACADWPLDTDLYHLWTIQDAKDGDVLATIDYILVFKEFLKNDGGISYCHYDFGAGNPQFIWLEDKNWYFGKEAIIHPATKEQRNLLFKKMHEAGYEWDADRLELKKIEQNPAWSEDDQSNFNELSSFILETYRTEDASRLITWLESLKNRVLPQPKQEWSEEDDRHRLHTISLVEDLREWANKDGMHSLCLERCAESIDWLKSLRPQNTWKPSDEQMKAMQKALVDLCGKDEHNIITGLYYDLKKLKD